MREVVHFSEGPLSEARLYINFPSLIASDCVTYISHIVVQCHVQHNIIIIIIITFQTNDSH